jgi:hypothetical protein
LPIPAGGHKARPYLRGAPFFLAPACIRVNSRLKSQRSLRALAYEALAK